jgi:hypothetical protein
MCLKGSELLSGGHSGRAARLSLCRLENMR